jgi:hypothetical protein
MTPATSTGRLCPATTADQPSKAPRPRPRRAWLRRPGPGRRPPGVEWSTSTSGARPSRSSAMNDDNRPPATLTGWPGCGPPGPMPAPGRPTARTPSASTFTSLPGDALRELEPAVPREQTVALGDGGRRSRPSSRAAGRPYSRTVRRPPACVLLGARGYTRRLTRGLNRSGNGYTQAAGAGTTRFVWSADLRK